MKDYLTSRDLKRIETDKRILAAAAKVFGSYGYTHSSLVGIGKEAGVTGGLLTQRFATKENLLCEAYRSALSDWTKENLSSNEVADAFLAPLKLYKTSQKDYYKIIPFLKMLLVGTDLPASITELRRQSFTGSILDQTITAAQMRGDIAAGDSFIFYQTFILSAINYIDTAVRFGFPLPDEEQFLIAIGFFDSKIKRTLKKNEAMINAFSESFFGLFYIYLETDTYEVLTAPDFMQDILNPKKSAREIINKAVCSMVLKDYINEMLSFTDLDSIAERLMNKKLLSLDYLGYTGDWSRCSFIPVMKDESGSVTEILLGLREISREEEYLAFFDKHFKN